MDKCFFNAGEIEQVVFMVPSHVSGYEEMRCSEVPLVWLFGVEASIFLAVFFLFEFHLNCTRNSLNSFGILKMTKMENLNFHESLIPPKFSKESIALLIYYIKVVLEFLESVFNIINIFFRHW